MSPGEYYKLTELEKTFIRKRHEQKFMSEQTWIRNSVFNAMQNIHRKKGKGFVDLFKVTHKADKEYNEEAVKNIENIEITKGKSWVDRVYRANGMEKPIFKERSD